ncbi:DUF6247 family protein [Streptomyces werraensis]|uniref:DUF6247 family protein n=1 Tax=Streptomyces werraensis TaxID=68284 RepID=UPI0037D120A3
MSSSPTLSSWRSTCRRLLPACPVTVVNSLPFSRPPVLRRMMSAQPGNAPVPPYAPAPGVPAEFLTQLRADTWASAFECEGAAALEESRRTFSLGGLYEVLQEWQGRLASAPAVDAFVASGYDDSDFIGTAVLWGGAGDRAAIRGPLLRPAREGPRHPGVGRRQRDRNLGSDRSSRHRTR